MKILSLLFSILIGFGLFCNNCVAVEYQNTLKEVDVAGVRLNMTPSQAIGALLKYDSGYKIEKTFFGSGMRRSIPYPSTGSSIKHFSKGEKSMLFGVTAFKGPDTFKEGGPLEKITVYFYPSLDQGKDFESVVAVIRYKTYGDDEYTASKTLRASFMNAIQKKMKVEPTVQHTSNGTVKSAWVFNDQGQIRTKKSLSVAFGDFCMVYPSQYAPERISDREPINLQIIVGKAPENDILINGFTMILIDSSQLIKAYYKALDISAIFKKQEDQANAKGYTNEEKL